MQNEMDFYGHNNEFEYNNDFVILLKYKYIYISLYTKYNYTYLCKSICILQYVKFINTHTFI